MSPASKISTLQPWSSLEYKYFHWIRKTLSIWGVLSGMGSSHGSEYVGVSVLIQAGSSHTFLLCRAINGIIHYVLMLSINVSVLTPVTMGPHSYLALGAHKLSPLPEPSDPAGGWQGKVCVALGTLSGAVWAEGAVLADWHAAHPDLQLASTAFQ